jgi:hypothetical protein
MDVVRSEAPDPDPSSSEERVGAVIVLAVSICLSACAHNSTTPVAPPPTHGSSPLDQHHEQSTQPSGVVPLAATSRVGCEARASLPDSRCTPGAVMKVDVEVVCHESTKGRRHVAASVHQRAFTDYGLPFPQPRGAFEVDHLIPLELGGDNTIENIWAEAAEPRPGFHEKDRVENYLHRKVCAGGMPLGEAQRLIATDWLSVWHAISKGVDADAMGR